MLPVPFHRAGHAQDVSATHNRPAAGAGQHASTPWRRPDNDQASSSNKAAIVAMAWYSLYLLLRHAWAFGRPAASRPMSGMVDDASYVTGWKLKPKPSFLCSLRRDGIDESRRNQSAARIIVTAQ